MGLEFRSFLFLPFKDNLSHKCLHNGWKCSPAVPPTSPPEGRLRLLPLKLSCCFALTARRQGPAAPGLGRGQAEGWLPLAVHFCVTWVVMGGHRLHWTEHMGWPQGERTERSRKQQPSCSALALNRPLRDNRMRKEPACWPACSRPLEPPPALSPISIEEVVT